MSILSKWKMPRPAAGWVVPSRCIITKKVRPLAPRKIPGLQESGAELIATACPGCIMQLQDIINHAGLPVRAVHILELLAEALK